MRLAFAVKQGTYLHVILTANALLMAGLLWTQVVGGSAELLGTQTAVAQGSKDPTEGVPNAANQRQKMIETLREVKTSVDAMKKSLDGGKIRVEISNPD